METRVPSRTVDKLVEEQIKIWQMGQKKKYKRPIRPVITLSRLPGAKGTRIAQKISEDLKIDFFHDKIVEEVAKRANVSNKVVETLDEQDRSILDDLLASLSEKHMWPHQYIDHLTKVIGTIGTHGHAVIVGRGAGFILPQEVCLRVLIIAPTDVRVKNLQEEYNISQEEARKRVINTDSDRRAFIRRYFHSDMLDPLNYDIVINTGTTSIETAVNMIKEAFNSRHWYDYSVKR